MKIVKLLLVLMVVYLSIWVIVFKIEDRVSYENLKGPVSPKFRIGAIGRHEQLWIIFEVLYIPVNRAWVLNTFDQKTIERIRYE